MKTLQTISAFIAFFIAVYSISLVAADGIMTADNTGLVFLFIAALTIGFTLLSLVLLPE